MKWKDIIHLAYLQICLNKMRSILCLSAVAIGVFSLILITNIGSFASTQINNTIETLGLQGMTVYLDKVQNNEVLTAAFAEHLEDEIEEITTATPVKFAVGSYKAGHIGGNVALIGCKHDIASSLGIQLLHGQNIPDERFVDIKNPVVISEHFAQNLFRRSNVVGKQFYITVNGIQERYTIIGIIQDQIGAFTNMFGNSIPELAYIPLYKLSAQEQADQILFSAKSDFENIKSSVQDTAKYAFGMQSTLGIQNLSSYKSQIQSMTHKVEIFLLLFALLGIITAAFAIENGILAAMQEMRSELLLYRVIGFRRIDIIRFFFVFSAMLCFSGAMLGTFIGMLLIKIIQIIALPSFHFQIAHLVTVLMTSAVLSLLGGMLPACQLLSNIKKELYDTK